MEKTNYNGSTGVGFAGLLTILFIALKLMGFIDWSWWWVLSPIWISVGLVIVILLIVFIIVLIKAIIEDRQEYHRKKHKEIKINMCKEAKMAGMCKSECDSCAWKH